jgi:hypothetical protein
MRKTIRLLGLLGGLAMLACAPGLLAEESARFFNGKDLAGWEGKSELWSVKDGAIVGSTFPDGLKGNTFLCSTKKYSDFRLSFQVKLKEGKGNSGVQIRSKVVDEKGFVVAGPQADIATGYWGSLYGEKFGGMMKQASKEDVEKAKIKNDDFNEYSIEAVGKHVTLKVNGVTTVDQDFEKMPEEGIIAWQVHAGGPLEVTFKNIKFTDLSKK